MCKSTYSIFTVTEIKLNLRAIVEYNMWSILNSVACLSRWKVLSASPSQPDSFSLAVLCIQLSLSCISRFLLLRLMQSSATHFHLVVFILYGSELTPHLFPGNVRSSFYFLKLPRPLQQSIGFGRKLKPNVIRDLDPHVEFS